MPPYPVPEHYLREKSSRSPMCRRLLFHRRDPWGCGYFGRWIPPYLSTDQPTFWLGTTIL